MATGSSVSGERRQLTILFSDLVGSTQLSAELDPEDWHDIVSRYHQAVTALVNRFEGHVAQYLGDGVLVLFGYPKAHENDAERAVRAGLELLEQMKSLNSSIERDYGKRLAVRAGIHTGEVMVRLEGGDAGNVFGETPNIAARVQASAEPDTVCVSATTQRLVAGFFVVDDLGPHILKGVPEPIRLYRVLRYSGVRSRLHATAKSSLTPFVGREEERNLLMNRWTQAQKGKGQLVMITGEAGIGKSRLLQQFKEDLGGIPHTWIEGESSPYEQTTPFAPTLDLVSHAFQWTPDTPVEEKIDALERSFTLVGIDPAGSVPLIASLFGFEIPAGRYPPLLLSPEQQRAQLLQTLVDWMIGTARLQPTVLVVEDLQYADPSTLEEFVMLGEQVEDIPLMLLFTARPRFTPPWPTKPFHTSIDLRRLARENIHAMIDGLLGQQEQNGVVESLVMRADGVPLFAEELSHAITAAADSKLPASVQRQIPTTLQDLLMARLDALGSLKEIAQTGAVLGREFSFGLLSSIAGMAESDLQAALVELTASGLVFTGNGSADTIYTFKHALFQEVAYGALLKSRRRELHRAVAKSLRENFTNLAKQRPELVAHHLTEAGDAEAAVEAWQEAGDYATARAALMEAHQHYSRALEILFSLPDTPDRAQMELPVQISLGNIASAIKGFGSAEEERAFSRARQISDQLCDSPQFFFILLGLWTSKNSRSEIKASREIADQMLRIAERDKMPLMEVWAHFTQAMEAYAIGNFSGVGEHIEAIERYYRPEDHSWSPFDPYVTVLGHAVYSLWQLGYTDQALQKARQQLEIAEQISPPNVAMARMTTCNLSMYLQDAEALAQAASDMLRIGEEQQLPSFHAWGTMYQGIALILQKKNQEGTDVLTRGMAAYLASGTHSSLGWYLSRLATGYAQAGEVDLALKTIQDAFGAAPDEKMHLPELHRLRADFLRMKGEPGDLESIEEDYRQAIAFSREFAALAQELRAATHLGRLLQAQGRPGEAHALLAPIYAQFSEGFDTQDLIEAQRLLEEVSVLDTDLMDSHRS